MGAQTNISWCDHTHNHWIGCSKVSPACDGCYAEAMMDKRYHRVQWGGPGQGAGTRALTSEGNRQKPLAWDRAAAAAKTHPFVFCSSLADVFDNQVPPEWRADLFDLIRKTPNLVWLLLTKRPQNIVKMVKAVGFMPRNIAFGTTVEDRARVEQNLPHLMVAAGLRPLFLFASCEPLLGDLGDLSPWLQGDKFPQHLEAGERFEKGIKIGADGWPKLAALGWMITGHETDQGGHEARPTHWTWPRSIRDQCAQYGTAFHHKQNGEWASVCDLTEQQVEACYPPRSRRFLDATRRPKVPETVMHADGSLHGAGDIAAFAGKSPMQMFKVGKTKSGRLLAGVEHNGFPEIKGETAPTAT